MGCSCQGSSASASTYKVVVSGEIKGVYSTQVEAEAAALRLGGAVIKS